ncbi:signal peptide peptidase SppA [Aureimonas phyllosphaerae]|uniref:Protease-4 n=1 Tax=Aureimonas phyllosphaerae TaxID=1166078 RepID=A0A7W6BZ64_9HYPH|nr:signal peptide peptidase SppA [Aureimonas phyllosphaerae]MBB3937450.1 protease-4 [Aureimonas phyllosphaerae]MBB3961484.1 protease-4 [Aureimonas phyllosphaerae]SFF38620.1 signal peptide peptidase A. Serine peptidase. MEROPS family S49 [Aureimonas phyllosphaerae]
MDAQGIIDRRRLRRKLSFWRVVALCGLALAVLLAVLAAGWQPGAGLGPTIARVEISGVITEDRKMLDLLEDLAEDDAVKAVIVKVNSPGGTTVGGETLFHAVRRLAEAKPVAAEVGQLAASAGYMVAMATDRIVAHHSSIVGSIGVLFQYVDASVLLGRIGVDVAAVKSSPLKAEPSPFDPAPPEAREMIGRLVNSSFDWFKRLVTERRGFTPAETDALADGSVFSGEQGLANRLVDALGGEAEVRRWLEDERGVPKGLEIVEREPESEGRWGLSSGARALAVSLLGFDPAASGLAQAVAGATGRLDGMVSLWQPPGH